MKKRIPELIEAFILPHIPTPYTLYAVEWEKIGADFVLSILVDKPGGIEIDETAELSQLFSPLLDQLEPDPFPKEGYLLEVASPGAERPLYKSQDYLGALGEQVLIRLYQKIEGKKEFVGDLIQVEEGGIILEVSEKTVAKKLDIPFGSISKGQTLIRF